MNLERLEVRDLLRLQADITCELKKRGIARTNNNPLGDYTEWLVAKALNLELARNSKAGYDALGGNERFQIKGRRVTSTNHTRQLSAIRNYFEKDFDTLIAVIYDEDFSIMEAFSIPHGVVGEYATYRSHVNAHLLRLKGPILQDPRVQNIKYLLMNEGADNVTHTSFG